MKLTNSCGCCSAARGTFSPGHGPQKVVVKTGMADGALRAVRALPAPQAAETHGPL